MEFPREELQGLRAKLAIYQPTLTRLMRRHRHSVTWETFCKSGQCLTCAFAADRMIADPATIADDTQHQYREAG